MTNPIANNLYPVANAVTSSATFVDVVTNRNPTSHDNQYQIQKKWFNVTNGDLWYLASFTPTNTILLANWVLLTSSVSPLEKLQGNTGGAVSPDGSNIIHTIGDGIGITVAGNPGTNTLTWSLVGGGVAMQKVGVDTFTAPGTNPVLPTAAGLITVTGGQIPAGTTGNVIQTNSLAANTYTIQVQRSQAVAVSTMADNGVCHFDSAAFQVDSSAFVKFPTINADTGTAYPATHAFTIAGSGTISTSASGSTVTIASTTGTSAFFAYPNADFNTGNLGTSATTITFNTTDFNVGANYSTGTGLYTAPATGLYSFQCTINMTNLGAATNTPSLYFIRNASELYRFTEFNFLSGAQNVEGYAGAVVLQLTSGETIGLAVGDNALGGGPFNFTVRGRIAGPPIININYFSGIRLT